MNPSIPAPTETPCRLGVVETVYHQEKGQNPTSVQARYHRYLESSEQPFTRRLTLGEGWQEIEAGWIEQAGMIHLANEAGKGRQRTPSPQEQEQAAGQVVEVGIACTLGSQDVVWSDIAVCWVVRPGETLRAEPADLGRLRLRCRKGTARVLFTLLPR